MKTPQSPTGLSQPERQLEALQPDYIGVEDHTPEELLTLIQQYAKGLNFYDLSNQIRGNWSAFFQKDFETMSGQPHFALIWTFLQLLQYPKQQFNNLPAELLNFYYSQGLKLFPRKTIADTVNVAFTPTKQTSSIMLPQGTLLNAEAASSKGAVRQYATTQELQVTSAQISHVMTLALAKQTPGTHSPGESAESRSKITGFYTQSIDLSGKPQPWSALGAPLQGSSIPSGKRYQPGFTVTSQGLVLPSGTRTITLTLTCHNIPATLPTDLSSAFSVHCHMTGQTIPAQSSTAQVHPDQSSLEISATFGSSAPPIQPTVQKNSAGQSITEWPRIECRLTSLDSLGSLTSLKVKHVQIQVNVSEATNVLLRNDSVLLNPKFPFAPFGNQPEVGDSLYLAGPALSTLPLTNLTLNLTWKTAGAIADSSTMASKQGALNLVSSNGATAFGKPLPFTATQSDSAQSALTFTPSQSSQNDLGDFALHSTKSSDPRQWERYFQLELSNTKSKPPPADPSNTVTTKSTIKTSPSTTSDEQTTTSATVTTTSQVAPPPAKPILKSFSVNYNASWSFPIAEPSTSSASQLMCLHPFGEVTVTTENAYLFLQDTHAGNLYLGVEQVQLPQNLSVLFSIHLALSEVGEASNSLQWSYLNGNQWVDFHPGNILIDTTDQLMTSGIICWSLPQTVNFNGTRMPPGVFWLRAVSQTTPLPATISKLWTNAVSATLQVPETSQETYSFPLAAEQISKLAHSNPQISKVVQPLTSFGGRAAESTSQFNTRVSERLKHKQRALAPKDYEQLVLEQFPQIYAAKCLTQAEQRQIDSQKQVDFQPGTVTVLVFPNSSPTSQISTPLLLEIEEWLQQWMSPSARLEVRLPIYQAVQYRMAVRFIENDNTGYYVQQLNQAIIQFLSPWDNNSPGNRPWVNTVYNSAVLFELQQLPYVDYLANFRLLPNPTYRVEPHTYDAEIAIASRPDAILISAPHHWIDLVEVQNCDPLDYQGIGYMEVEADFIIYP